MAKTAKKKIRKAWKAKSNKSKRKWLEQNNNLGFSSMPNHFRKCVGLTPAITPPPCRGIGNELTKNWTNERNGDIKLNFPFLEMLRLKVYKSLLKKIGTPKSMTSF